ncbi:MULTISPECIES: hypothetical protein [unclassified Streptomyces]|uniref:hypothetical protein n=1 Tax=unclassified Streptomyces TaxID=2593676 RepID=UPI0035D7375C
MSLDFLGRPTTRPPANTVTAACRLCSYMGPTHWIATPLPDVLEDVAAHVREDHPRAGAEESYPKLYEGFVNGLTEQGRIRVNAERALDPYVGETCPPDCDCGQSGS